ncbi:hypothetical protein D1872_260910 [compost metagenome]
MLEQPVAYAVRPGFGPDPRIDVVVHLDVSDAVVLHQPADHLGRVRPDRRIPVVQLIPAPVFDPFAVPHKEPAVIRIFQLGTVDAHDFQLQPQARNHALASNIVKDIFDAFRETFLRGQPLAYAVPPFPCGIPTGIDAKVFASRLSGGIDQRQQLRGRRAAP